MNLRNYVVALVAVLVLGVGGALFVLPAPQYRVDLTQVNNITETLAGSFEHVGTDGFPLPSSDYDYAVIDNEGKLLQATRRGLSEDVNAALRQGDMVVDIVRDGQTLGRVIVHSEAEKQWAAYRTSLQALLIASLLALAAISAVFFVHLHRQILRPFKDMRAFAQRVAAGELDAPLVMDRRNIFGAFTESFDLMREELRRARENEQAAERSKRELVASLSHDIQTPVSSIKAAAEVMEVTADEANAQKLKTIQEKASQIQTLVTQLFHTTLEELDSLSVQPVPVPSDSISEMIKTADYQGRVMMGEFPGCLVQADPARLAQVMDNIISNSYKYAGTGIDVSAELDEGGLMLTLRDHGPGVADEDLPRLYIKYFRGASAEGKNGYGLGLFIANHLIERMGGRLECTNANPGFKTRIWLSLDGAS